MSETMPPPMEHEDSISTQDPHNSKDKKVKSRRPANTAFRQQRLKAWQPILTPKSVLPLFFVLGVIFAPIGGGLLYASAQVSEIVLDYSTCYTDAPTDDFGPMNSSLVHTAWKGSSNSTTGISPQWFRTNITVNYGPSVTLNRTQCQIQFHIPENLNPPVLFYYRLTNFYQNHRRYVKSLDTDQLSGDFVDNHTISSSACDPLRLDAHGKAYYPCGLIANSLFNDTFSNPVLLNVPDSSEDFRVYNMSNNSGISWSSDKKLYGKTKYTFDQVAVPPNWVERYPNGSYSEDYPLPDIENDEAFQVWMRTAGLPTFSKLAQRNDHDIMQAGDYQVNITHNFPVTEYGGTKSIVISTSTIMGGKNPFLGIAYVVVGGLCIVLGVMFLVAHLIKPRKLGDHTYLTWNNNEPSTATTSGREIRPEGA